MQIFRSKINPFTLTVILLLFSSIFSVSQIATGHQCPRTGSTGKPKEKKAVRLTVGTQLSAQRRSEIAVRNAAIAATKARIQHLLTDGRLSEAKVMCSNEISRSVYHRAALTDISVEVLIQLADFNSALVLLNHASVLQEGSGTPSFRDSLRSWLQCKVGQFDRARLCRNDRVILNVLGAIDLPDGFVAPPILPLDCERMAALALGVHRLFVGDEPKAKSWCMMAVALSPNDCLSNYFLGMSCSNDIESFRHYLNIARLTAPPGLERHIRIWLRQR